MNLPIIFDFGNSFAKVLDSKSKEVFRFTQNEFRSYLESCSGRPLFGCVSGDASVFDGLSNSIHVVSTSDKAPLVSQYGSMDSLGTDRWALCNAYFLSGQKSFLLVTMGTCITYNVVKEGIFLGGAISPGWDLRYWAMHQKTSSLPLAEYSENTPLLGSSTIGSLKAGVDVALQKELDAMIKDYSESFQLNNVLICGGASERLSKPLKNYIFAPVNYELQALWRLYEYYADHGTF